jgi:hypothetical protein
MPFQMQEFVHQQPLTMALTATIVTVIDTAVHTTHAETQRPMETKVSVNEEETSIATVIYSLFGVERTHVM